MIIAVDFDNTLFKTDYPHIKEPMYPTINYIKRAQERGDRIILWTCRQGQDLTAALEACEHVGLTFEAVNCNPADRIALFDGNDCRKVGADLYIDDKAIRPEELEDEDTPVYSV